MYESGNVYRLTTFTPTHGHIWPEQEAEGQFRHFRPIVCHELSRPALRLQKNCLRVHLTQVVGFV